MGNNLKQFRTERGMTLVDLSLEGLGSVNPF